METPTETQVSIQVSFPWVLFPLHNRQKAKIYQDPNCAQYLLFLFPSKCFSIFWFENIFLIRLFYYCYQCCAVRIQIILINKLKFFPSRSLSRSNQISRKKICTLFICTIKNSNQIPLDEMKSRYIHYYLLNSQLYLEICSIVLWYITLGKQPKNLSVN